MLATSALVPSVGAEDGGGSEEIELFVASSDGKSLVEHAEGEFVFRTPAKFNLQLWAERQVEGQ